MGIELAKAFVTVRADAKRLPADLTRIKSRVTRAMSNIASVARGLNKTLVAMSAVAVTVGARQLVSMANQRIELAKRQIDAEQRLAAVVKATGAAAGFQASELQNFAAQLQKSTTVGDEAILESMAVLLTFRSITGDAFKETTKLALDMSAVMGNDAKGAILQLGKALEDPITGLGALRRSGISFNEQQKEQIKNFVEMNKLAKAQGIILKVVRDQLGGVAESLAKTDAGRVTQLTNKLNDMREELGRKLLPLQAELLQVMIDLQPTISAVVDEFSAVAREIGPLVKELLPDLLFLLKSLTIVTVKFVKFGLTPLAAGLKVIAGPLAAITKGFKGIIDTFNGLKKVDLKQTPLDKDFLKKRARELAEFREGKDQGGIGKLSPDEQLFMSGFGGGRDPRKRKAREAAAAAAAAKSAAQSRAPTTQRSPLQEGLGAGAGGGLGMGGMISGLGMAVATALTAPPVIEALGKASDVGGGRSGFAELGIRIQDALLQADQAALDKERNGMLKKQLNLSEQMINAVQEQDKRLGLS